ncbi:hypothetical protein GCM10009000_065540 [Halobacterium noricense]|uniref:Uncharacterized protein n=1 Tax=Haladaptatus pallidirubidus TaxID=1008152 RepID=A0AAV3UHR5_9EURY
MSAENVKTKASITSRIFDSRFMEYILYRQGFKHGLLICENLIININSGYKIINI